MLDIKKERIHLKKLGHDIVINFFSLADDEWIEDKYGNGVEAIFKEFKVQEILEILWHQLTDESKRLIVSAKIVEWEGLEEKELSFDSPISKMKHIITGKDELLAIWSGLIKAKTQSLGEQDDKKKAEEVKREEESH